MADTTKTTKLYSFRLDIDLIDKIRKQAEDADLTLTQLVQRYLKAGANNDPLQEQPQPSSSSNNLSRAALLQSLVQLLATPEIHLPEAQSTDLKALTQEIEQLRQKVEQFEQKLTSP